MSQLEEMKIKLDGIGHVISDNNLSVPKYQRSYAWTDKQITDLLTDTNEAINRNEKEYFLGSMVITGNERERLEVVDGQQRLATVTIIMAAIRDYFFRKNDINRSNDITSQYLMKRHIRSQEIIPRLYLNEIDHNFFAKKILSMPDSTDRNILASRESHKRIEQASIQAKNYIQSLVENTSKPTEVLIDWVEYFHTKAKIISVSVPDHANAFTIFETLNDRGLELAVSDLLKNYLFSVAQDRIGEVQHHWTEMIGLLEAVANEEIVVTYIRQLWLSKEGLAREKELYDKIKATISSKQSAVDFSVELLRNARLYAAVLNTSSDVLDNYGSTVKNNLDTLNLLAAQQIRPLILSILDKFQTGEAQRSFKFLVSLAVRISIVGRTVGGGTLESNYSQRAIEIRKEEIKTARELAAAMKGIIPGDKEFETAFKTATVSKSNLARYYLRALETQSMKTPQPDFVPNNDEQMVNLEHILPQNPSSAWGYIDPENAQAYYNRIGNLTLLQKKINLQIGNSGFGEKISKYKDSTFKLTPSSERYSKWGLEEIESRQAELAQLAVETWSIKV